jgi:hypothetical protein
VGYLGLIVAIVGLVLRLSGSTGWLLAAGVIFWLVAAAVTLTGLLRARHELGDSRPGLWSMRMMLVYDTVHTRPEPRSPAAGRTSP